MRHRKSGVKLNRTASHRKAMFRNMVTSLLKYERIRTTDAKAKELRRLADNMITLAKRGDLHARRQALAVIREKAVVHKLFENANERFGNINGGYTRVVKLGRRPGDAAPVSIIELVVAEPEKKKKKKKKNKADVETPAAPTAAPEDESAESADDAPMAGEKADGADVEQKSEKTVSETESVSAAEASTETAEVVEAEAQEVDSENDKDTEKE